MSEPVLLSLIGAATAIVTGLLTLLGTRWLARIQAKAAENEDRIRKYEEYDHLLDNYRTDYDRARADLTRVRQERDDAIARAVRAEQKEIH